MNSLFCGMIAAISLLLAAEGMAKTAPLTDAQIKKAIIAESISQYPGTCACPYNQARNGSHCGKRSAWSRAGGYAPVCYDNEVTKEMMDAWRERQR
nr:hypothetical protein [Kosakonia sp.]